MNPRSVSNDGRAAQSSSLRLYGRRKGKRLRPSRQALLDTLLPKLNIEPGSKADHLTPEALFGSSVNTLWLEIGFGAGEHLAAQAKANPAVGIIGAEIFENGIASLLRHCEQEKLSNVRIFTDDVRELLPALVPESVNRVFLLYPDPWPKTRHAKRRFVSPENLAALARIMMPGAELRIATDHPVYLRWCLRHGPTHPDFTWRVSGPADWRQRPADGVPTRYEGKAIQAGRRPAYLTLVRQ